MGLLFYGRFIDTSLFFYAASSLNSECHCAKNP